MPRGSNEPKTVITDETRVERVKPTQTTLDVFEQKKIEDVERWAAKFDAKRDTINGLQGELKNIELKLREAMHANEPDVDHQESEDGDSLLVYKRGDFNVVVKRGKEKVNVKIGEKSQGEPPSGGDDDEDEN